MYDIIRLLRTTVIIAFILVIIWKVAQNLLLPIVIFIIVMKLFSSIKINKKTANKKKSKKKKDRVIDVDYEDVD